MTVLHSGLAWSRPLLHVSELFIDNRCNNRSEISFNRKADCRLSVELLDAILIQWHVNKWPGILQSIWLPSFAEAPKENPTENLQKEGIKARSRTFSFSPISPRFSLTSASVARRPSRKYVSYTGKFHASRHHQVLLARAWTDLAIYLPSGSFKIYF